MNNWDNLTPEEYFNLGLIDRVKFYADNLVIQYFDGFQNPNFLKYYYDGIIKVLFDGLTNKKYTKQISSDLGHFTKVWGIDWHWIVHHIKLDYSNILVAKDILERFDENALVYKYMFYNDCISCKKLYLKNISNNEPKTFIISHLIKNGHNIKFNIKEFKPVIGATIFSYNEYIESFDWDYSTLMHLPYNYHWDKKKQMFTVNTISRKKMIKRRGGFFKSKLINEKERTTLVIEFIKIKKNSLWNNIKCIFKK